MLIPICPPTHKRTKSFVFRFRYAAFKDVSGARLDVGLVNSLMPLDWYQLRAMRMRRTKKRGMTEKETDMSETRSHFISLKLLSRVSTMPTPSSQPDLSTGWLIDSDPGIIWPY
ncbi:hypothetical protein BT96DRAFT_927665 [Gymnopus androsaceus JB14]|uniref:Uncharacterized protein n=1 Tax=Gymnopus androsaceus JB14 TaxID=1447944 RepID=A0A6A4GNI6_9AGAR|nr:hypothetical protein BT96DRAFT_927665 [Gymnopus androsaceus JB14]